MPPVHWQPDRAIAPPPWTVPPLLTALGRGLRGRCPVCGVGKIFNGFLRVVPECSQCATPLGLARADDAPPYFTILITGHLVIPPMIIVDRIADPPVWLLSVTVVPLIVILAVGLLRPVKGATVGLMLAFNMLKTDAETE